MSDSVTPWTVAHPDSLFFTISQSLLKLMSIDPGMPSNHLSLCHPLFLPSIFPSIRVFSNESALCLRCPKKWSFSCSISPSNEYSGFPLVLTSLISLQSKGLSRIFSSTTIQKHQFYGIHPSLWSNSHIHTWLLEKPQLWLYGPLLTKWCLCFFNMLSRFVIAFLSRTKHLFDFVAAVTVRSDFRAQENKICHSFHCLPIYLPWSDGTGCHDLHFLNVEF